MDKAMTRLLIIGAARTISSQLAAIQRMGIFPAGKSINPKGGDTANTFPSLTGGSLPLAPAAADNRRTP